MWFTRISIQNPVFATMMMVALVVLGLFAYQRMPVEKMPNVELPFAIVVTDYPGASPEIIETKISRPMEEKLSTISGIKNLTSESYSGQSFVFVEFELDTNMDRALNEVREKANQAKVDFPREVKEPYITQARQDRGPTITVALTSDKLTERQMTIRADQYIQRQFQTVKGVGRVRLIGGIKRQLNIELLPEKLHAFGIGADQVIADIRKENQEIPVGNIEFDKTERVVQLKGRLVEAADFGKIVVARRNGQPILLSQVANVIDGEQTRDSSALVNGKRALSIEITKVSGANTIQVADDIHAMVNNLNKELEAESIQMEVIVDESSDIRRSLADVKSTLLEGAVLTVLIVWLFLGSWRSTVITGLTLPVALIGTFFFLQAFGFTINGMTLMALSLCVGLVVDDAIVVRENIVRHAEMGKSHYQAALDGTAEIGLAVLATTLTIVAVFMPVGFMGGLIGKFFFQFGIAVCAAVLISMFVSFTLDPMLSSVWHDPHAHGMKHTGPLGRVLDSFERGLDNISAFYARTIEWVLNPKRINLPKWLVLILAVICLPITLFVLATRPRARTWFKSGLKGKPSWSHRSLVLMAAITLFFGSFLLVPFIGAEFQPKADSGRIKIDYRTPIGSSLDYTTSKAEQVEDALRAFSEIKDMYTAINTGESDGKHIAHTNLNLIEKNKRISQDALIKKIRDRLTRIAGIELRSVSGAEGGGGGNNAPIFITIQGKDFGELKRIAENVAERLGRIKHVINVQTSLRAAKPAIDINVNREMASTVGLSVSQVGATLAPLVAGEEIGSWQAPDGESYEIIVRLPENNRRMAEDLANLPIASTDIDARTGQPIMIPLSQVADIKASGTPTLIQRRNLFRNVEVYADVEGVPVGEVQPEVDKLLKQIQMPQGYRFVQEGAERDMGESLNYAVQALLIGVIFIYLILASQFGSFSQPLAIMTALPLSVVGIFLALLAWGSTLNLFSIIGIIMLMGLVTKNAILLIDFVNRLRNQGMERFAAIVEAGRVRLRPILMTTFAMIGGMLPLALALGEGAEQRAPMAHAIIGGVITSTLLTLVVVPVVFTYLDDLGMWLKQKFAGKHTDQPPQVKDAAPQPGTGR
ncbi:efflux RND transporter permease subunit [Chitinimonas sp. BJB300]|uniref:efflux RND transporter permease subunit n=1 Tax=Chitinimonas sp. BJB300 TaxID=1559339 RepID=UPI000C0E2F65|nr:efflux RND transporter permease subunit [Chitinimonas sp. BJB300]PHV13299.1 nodulation protein NolG [Chitinimonas sp. BJB300]TSJ85996.1 efflux RND transporter permease subunit [Chitinimonas sp. BJB300]